MIDIKLAAKNDVDTVAAMHAEASAWLAGKGLDQWQPEAVGQRTAEKVRENIKKTVEEEHCYLAYLDGEVAGTVTVDSYADPEFWTAEDAPESAVYVHRMIVRRKFSGRSLGRILLLIADEVARQAGRKFVRLDAWSTNKDLHAYYERMGFENVRTLRFPHRGSGALFQRAVPERPAMPSPPWSSWLSTQT